MVHRQFVRFLAAIHATIGIGCLDFFPLLDRQINHWSKEETCTATTLCFKEGCGILKFSFLVSLAYQVRMLAAILLFLCKVFFLLVIISRTILFQNTFFVGKIIGLNVGAPFVA